MLKRLQNKKTARQSTIGIPVLVESNLNEGVYNDLNHDGRRPLSGNVEWKPQVLKAKQHHPPQSKTRLPPRIDSLQAPHPTKLRPTSSIYSQPSAGLPVQYYTRESIYTDDIEISPPSSPEVAMNFGKYRSKGDEAVSPIDETDEPTFPTLEARKGRSIPVMRREKRRNEAAERAANIQSRRTASVTPDPEGNGSGPRKTSAVAAPKYDPYTGEPTTDEKGRPQQVKPSAFSGGDRPVHSDPFLDRPSQMGVRTTVTANNSNPSSFADRIRRLREKNSTTTTTTVEERPAWKGASGRQAVIAPPTQPLNAKPFSVPRKTNRRVTAPESHKYGDGSGVKKVNRGNVDETRHFPSSTEMHPAFRNRPVKGYHRNDDDDDDDGDDDNREGGDEHSDNDLPPQPIASPTSLHHSPTAVTTTDISDPNLPPDPISASDLHDISVGVVERNFREALKESNLVISTSNYPEGQLPSKFSVTTYDPSTHITTPRPSSDSHHWTPAGAPPLPSKNPSPPSHTSATPIVHRRRPRINSIDSTTSPIPTRKPVPRHSEAMSVVTHGGRDMDNKKDLPLTPAEKAAKSQDLCVILQAQLDNLARRRANLEKSIHQMTELMPLDGMMGGIGGAFAGGGNMRNHVIGAGNNGGWRQGRSVMGEKFTEKRREEEKLKVEELKNDLADVKIEEHEIGLRLHRAWKRRDEGAVYEPTTLWVRRITG